MTDSEIIKILTEKLEQASKPKWVKVADHLPETEDGYLASTSIGLVLEVYFSDGEFTLPTDHYIDEFAAERTIDSIVGWMPLPEAMEF